MQHPIDEFSVTDLRQTISQICRVLSVRRWWFIFPAGLAATIALLATHALPRKYAVRTAFERKRDVVLANMGRGWSEALDALRTTMVEDLRRPDAWLSAMNELKLPTAPSRVNARTPRLAGAAYLGQILAGLEVKSVQPETGRDIVTIELTGPDPRDFPALLNAVRDRYIATARERTQRILVDARQFYDRQTRQTAALVADAEAALNKLEKTYPGLNPSTAGLMTAEIVALTDERNSLMRRNSALRSDIEDRRERLAQFAAAAANPAPPPTEPTRTAPNPVRATIESDLTRVRREIAENRGTRGMTEQHPTIISLAEKIKSLEAELIRTPAVVAIEVSGASDAAPAAQGARLLSEAGRTEQELIDIERQQRQIRERQAAIQVRLEQLATQQEDAADHGPEYDLARQNLEKVRAEMDSWRANIDPLDRLLKVQSGDRGVLFATVEKPTPAEAPVAPGARNVLLACFIIGLAIGIVSMLTAEFSDRSFRSVGQVSAVLGVPVLEGVHEIVTERERRRRHVRRWIVLPIMTTLTLVAVIAAAGLAYLRLTTSIDVHVFDAVGRMLG